MAHLLVKSQRVWLCTNVMCSDLAKGGCAPLIHPTSFSLRGFPFHPFKKHLLLDLIQLID